MDESTVEAPEVLPAESSGTEDESRRPRRLEPYDIALMALKFLASLRLTVVLFVFGIVLVFLGTLAQVKLGTFTVMDEYFRSIAVMIPFQLLVFFGQKFFWLPASWEVPGSFPYPGGWLIGGLLLANLLAAHAVRFKVSWRRSGIFLIHAGLIVLMLGELIAGVYQIESNMTMVEGETVSFVENSLKNEVAIIDVTDRDQAKTVGIPQDMLKNGAVIRDDELPFDVVVEEYLENSDLRRKKPGEKSKATQGTGKYFIAVPNEVVSGTEAGSDIPSAYITLKNKKTGDSLGTYMVSFFLYSNAMRRMLPDNPQRFTHEGREYEIFLRHQRDYKPYSMRLIEFKHDLYPGTDTPKNFSSLVKVEDAGVGEDREVLIYMNHPLFYRWETFYQSGYLPGDKGTVLQVVYNPGWQLPYFACIFVAVGMLVHFGLSLVRFLQNRAA